MENKTNQTIFAIFSLLLLSSCVSAQLRPDFYRNSCPNVETLVRTAVLQKFVMDFATAPATLNLFFRDCFVRGCDASILLASPSSEKDHHKGEGDDGFDMVMKAKQAVDRNPNCRNKVSCADILAIVTRDVIVLSGGPTYKVELGRKDGKLSTEASVQNNLPKPGFNLDQLNDMFDHHNLTQIDMIALSGAHTIGSGHCGNVTKRIYNFSPSTPIDPSIDPAYVRQLRQMCPNEGDPQVAINMDPTTPNIFDNFYFKNLQQGRGLFTSDQVLFTDKRSRSTVNLFANSEVAFRRAFVSAIKKLGRVGVKTGDDGEIRRDCSRVNE